MTKDDPRFVVPIPSGWRDAALPAPPVSAAGGVYLAAWSTVSNGRATLASGCAVAPLPGWVPEMHAPVESRTGVLVAWTAERIAGAPVLVTREAESLVVTLAGRAEHAAVGVARTLLAFDGRSRAWSCFVVCASDAFDEAKACENSVAAAQVTNTAAPPPPGVLLGALASGVRHPREAFAGALILATMFGVLAVARRRKPRLRV